MPITGSGERRRRGALEQQVLGCLASATGPLTPAEVQSALGSGLAYTTVMTTLARLCEKGALSREPAGRAYTYRLAGDPGSIAANVAAHRMHRLLVSADREQVLSRFVADLRPDDEVLLKCLLTKLTVSTPSSEPTRVDRNTHGRT